MLGCSKMIISTPSGKQINVNGCHLMDRAGPYREREMEGLRQLLKLQKVRSPRKLLKGESLGPVSSAGTGPASWSGVLTDSPSYKVKQPTHGRILYPLGFLVI